MNRGYLDTSTIIQTGITLGTALEVGPGPGHLGIEWLLKTQGTFLKGLDISQDMINMAQHNAQEFKAQDRVEYHLGDAKQIPFDDETFDAVFTNGSLHEWSDPKLVFDGIYRVLKPGGRYCITDLRRDITQFARIVLQFAIPKERKEGFVSPLNASSTQEELKQLIRNTNLTSAKVNTGLWTVAITGVKQ